MTGQRELIIIHGWTYTIEPWQTVVKMLESKGVKVRQLRVPGLTTPSEQVWTVNGYVDWLNGELANTSDAIVLGHSNGGRIALNYAIKHPGVIKHLILLSAAGLDYQTKQLSGKRKIFGVVAKIGRPLAKIAIIRKVFYRLIGSDYGFGPANMRKTLANMLESDKSFRPELVEVAKIDLLWGKADTVTPIAMGRELAKRLKGANLQEFNDWGHAPYIAYPEELVDAIMGVLEK